MKEELGETLSPPVEATLKWFNNPNGFGFLIPKGGEGTDAFVHITTLQEAGITALGEGARLLCHIDHSPKGAIVKKIIELLHPGTDPAEINNKSEENTDKCALAELQGVVKWFCAKKGFGFVTADDGKKDIFVHQSCLEKVGLETLTPDTRVSMNVRSVSKGREAMDITILT